MSLLQTTCALTQANWGNADITHTFQGSEQACHREAITDAEKGSSNRKDGLWDNKGDCQKGESERVNCQRRQDDVNHSIGQEDA